MEQNLQIWSGPGIFTVTLPKSTGNAHKAYSSIGEWAKLWPVQVQGSEINFLARKGWTLLMVLEWLRVMAYSIDVLFGIKYTTVDGQPVYPSPEREREASCTDARS